MQTTAMHDRPEREKREHFFSDRDSQNALRRNSSSILGNSFCTSSFFFSSLIDFSCLFLAPKVKKALFELCMCSKRRLLLINAVHYNESSRKVLDYFIIYPSISVLFKASSHAYERYTCRIPLLSTKRYFRTLGLLDQESLEIEIYQVYHIIRGTDNIIILVH